MLLRTLMVSTCLLLYSLLNNTAYANDFRFESMGLSDGLPSLEVTQIFQQSNGYLWFATDSGASRYDGRNFVTYSYEPGNKRHLLNSFITRMAEDTLGNIWFATEDGLNKLEPNGNIVRYSDKNSKSKHHIPWNWVITLYVDSKGNIWAGTGFGLVKYNSDTDNFEHVVLEGNVNDNELASAVYTIVEDDSNRLYFATNDGIVVLNPENLQSHIFKFEGESKKLRAQAAIKAKDGTLWFGTERYGLFSIDPVTKNTTFYASPNKSSLGDTEAPINTIIEMPNGDLWLGLSGQGVSIFSPTEESFTSIKHDEFGDYSIASNTVLNIFRDNSGLIWLATQNGVSYYSALKESSHIYRKEFSSKGLSHNQVYTSLIKDGSVWITTEDGLNRVDLNSHEVEIYKLNELVSKSKLAKEVWDIAENNDGRLWLVQDSGLVLFDPNTQSIEHFSNREGNAHGFTTSEIYTVISDNHGGVWLTGYRDVGLIHFHPDKGILAKYLNTPASIYFREGNFSIDSLMDTRGDIWLATTDGVFRINPTTGKEIQYRFNEQRSYIRTVNLEQDKNGDIWVATQGMGLVRFEIDQNDPEKVTKHFITTEHGLPSDDVKSVKYDEKTDTFWLTTLTQLIHYKNPRAEKPEFDFFPSLIGDKDVSFGENSISLVDETLLIGTNKGLVRVDLNKLDVNRFNPPVKITKIKVLDEELEDYLFKEGANIVDFDYEQNHIEFSMASLDYSAPEQNLYRYKLEGFDKKWSIPSNNAIAYYANLDVGEYTFRAQATNSDGVWSEGEANFTFSIAFAWWHYAILFLILLSCLFLFLFIYTRKLKLKELSTRAHHDNLTGLANRFYFRKQLDELTQVKKSAFTLLFLDIDNFKVINDSLGHSAGDDLLIHVAESLKSCVRKDDVLARFGGDEFAVIINNDAESESTILVIERIHSVLASTYLANGKAVQHSASIGVASAPSDGEDSETLLKNADIAMYAAKQAGRNKVTYFNDALGQALKEKYVIRDRLKTAIEQQEFSVYYQPKICCKSKQVSGFEGLLRWIHPEDGFISPAIFIPEAESSNAIVPIGEWVLKESCTQIRKWCDEGLIFKNVSVNISPIQILQPDIVETVKRILYETNCPANKLELEVTESLFIENLAAAQQVLEELRGLGISIALDDFGTGFSSLKYLTEMSIDTLKIDRSFLQNIESDIKSQMVLKNIFSLANDLEIAVVAEGIETDSHLSIVTRLNCEYVQGFLFSPAVTKDKATELLKQDNYALSER